MHVPVSSSAQPVVHVIPTSFKLQGLSIGRFISECEQFESMPLDILEDKVEHAQTVAKWSGEYGGGYRIPGKPVIEQRDSQRPSSTEPELFDTMTPIRRKTTTSSSKSKQTTHGIVAWLKCLIEF